MTSQPSPENLNSSHMDDLLSRQEEVIQELGKLDEMLLQTIEEFRASIGKKKPSVDSDPSSANDAADAESESVPLPKAA